MVDQVPQQGVRQPLLVRPLGIAEDAVQGLRVGLLDSPHRLLQGLPDIRRHVPDIGPVAALGDLEAVVLREQRVFFVAAGLVQGSLVFLVVDIRNAFEEQQREDVGLEVRGIHGTAQDVRRFPQVGFQLAQGCHAAIPKIVLCGCTSMFSEQCTAEIITRQSASNNSRRRKNLGSKGQDRPGYWYADNHLGRGDDVVVVVDLSHLAHENYQLGFSSPGTWRLRLNSDWSGYSRAFGNRACSAVVAGAERSDQPQDANAPQREGFPAVGTINIGSYSVLVFSQDRP